MDAATCKATIEALGFSNVSVGERDVLSAITGKLLPTGDKIAFAEGVKPDGNPFHFSHPAGGADDVFAGFVQGAEDTLIDEVFVAHDPDDGPNGFKKSVADRLGGRATPETIQRALDYLKARRPKS